LTASGHTRAEFERHHPSRAARASGAADAVQCLKVMPESAISQSEHSGLADLIAATARGEREAFAALFHLIAPKMNAHLLQQGLGQDRAESICLSAMVSMWRQAHEYDRDVGVWSWIFRILRDARTADGHPAVGKRESNRSWGPSATASFWSAIFGPFRIRTAR
jgi:hypothetical protein